MSVSSMRSTRPVSPLVFYDHHRTTLSPNKDRSKSPTAYRTMDHHRRPLQLSIDGMSISPGSPNYGSDDELSIYTNGYKPKHSYSTQSRSQPKISPNTVKYTGRKVDTPFKVVRFFRSKYIAFVCVCAYEYMHVCIYICVCV
jgi:hypothetical protein